MKTNYDSVTNLFDEFGPHATTETVLGLSRVKEIISPLSEKIVLDYGCGAGRFSRLLAAQGAQVMAVDSSYEMIKAALRHGSGGITYKHIDTGNLADIKSNSMDSAVLNFVLCTIASQSEIVGVLKEIHRTLKLGGMCVALNANWEKCNGREFVSFKCPKVEILAPGTEIPVVLKGEKPLILVDYFWPRKNYIDFFEKAGFKNVKVEERAATDDSYPWIDEKEYSPLFIVTGSK